MIFQKKQLSYVFLTLIISLAAVADSGKKLDLDPLLSNCGNEKVECSSEQEKFTVTFPLSKENIEQTDR